MRDLYVILGVPRDADAATLKRAYRQRAHRDHPDKNPGDKAAEERFKEASVAYDVLSDPERRRRYDQLGEAGLHAGAEGAGGPGGPGGFTGNVGDVFSEMFGDLFGRRGGSAGGGTRGRGRDRSERLRIDLATAVTGGQAPVTISREQPCEPCRGSGSGAGAPPLPCTTCGGKGQVRAQQGMFAFSRPCAACAGRGRVPKVACPGCGGSGRVRRSSRVQVRIPAGAREGAVLRLGGAGEPGPGGTPAGDLKLVLEVQPHPLLTRENNTLHAVVWVSSGEAALGTQVDVPTLAAPLRMKVPPGAQAGQRFRLRGQGAPARPGAAASDLMVTLQVEGPGELDAAATKAWREVGAHETDAAYPRRAEWRRRLAAQPARTS